MADLTSGVLPWLKLMRLPTVFTAMADILCGYLIIRAGAGGFGVFAELTLWLILAASASLYLSGMVWNDIFDLDLDRIERPERPLPSGIVSASAARGLASGMMGLGILLAAVAGGLHWGCVAVSLLLCLCILAYDKLLKPTWGGPLGMAACRFLNLFMGAVAAASVQAEVSAEVLTPAVWAGACLACHVLGVTVYARNEAHAGIRSTLYGGMMIVAAAWFLALVVMIRSQSSEAALGVSLLVVGFSCYRMAKGVIPAIRLAEPSLIQRTVGLMLVQIIFLDAALATSLSGRWDIAPLILLLVVPAFSLKKVIPLS